MKTALITGASSGIGLELAKIFAREGYKLVLVSRSIKKSDEFPENTVYIKKDLSELGAAKSLYEQTKKKKLKIDVLVNNAGFGDYQSLVDADLKKLGLMIELNVRCLTELSYFFAKDMKKQESGMILNLSSIAGFLPGPKMSVYYASKNYVLSFTEAIAEELEPYGITVTALCPGPTATNFQTGSDMGDSKLVKDKKLPTAQEVAEFGYQSLINGKRVAVYGFGNKVLVQLLRFVPRKKVARIINSIQ